MEEYEEDYEDASEVANPWPWSWMRVSGHVLAYASNLAGVTSTFLECMAQEVAGHVNYGYAREEFAEEAAREMESLLSEDE